MRDVLADHGRMCLRSFCRPPFDDHRRNQVVFLQERIILSIKLRTITKKIQRKMTTISALQTFLQQEFPQFSFSCSNVTGSSNIFGNSTSVEIVSDPAQVPRVEWLNNPNTIIKVSTSNEDDALDPAVSKSATSALRFIRTAGGSRNPPQHCLLRWAPNGNSLVAPDGIITSLESPVAISCDRSCCQPRSNEIGQECRSARSTSSTPRTDAKNNNKKTGEETNDIHNENFFARTIRRQKTSKIKTVVANADSPDALAEERNNNLIVEDRQQVPSYPPQRKSIAEERCSSWNKRVRSLPIIRQELLEQLQTAHADQSDEKNHQEMVPSSKNKKIAPSASRAKNNRASLLAILDEVESTVTALGSILRLGASHAGATAATAAPAQTSHMVGMKIAAWHPCHPPDYYRNYSTATTKSLSPPPLPEESPPHAAPISSSPTSSSGIQDNVVRNSTLSNDFVVATSSPSSEMTCYSVTSAEPDGATPVISRRMTSPPIRPIRQKSFDE